MSAPGAYIEWMNAHIGFNPRSQTNSNALSQFVIADLKQSGSALGEALNKTLLWGINIDVKTRVATRNVDLVIEDEGNDDSEKRPDGLTQMLTNQARVNRQGIL